MHVFPHLWLRLWIATFRSPGDRGAVARPSPSTRDVTSGFLLTEPYSGTPPTSAQVGAGSPGSAQRIQRGEQDVDQLTAVLDEELQDHLDEHRRIRSSDDRLMPEELTAVPRR